MRGELQTFRRLLRGYEAYESRKAAACECGEEKEAIPDDCGSEPLDPFAQCVADECPGQLAA